MLGKDLLANTDGDVPQHESGAPPQAAQAVGANNQRVRRDRDQGSCFIPGIGKMPVAKCRDLKNSCTMKLDRSVEQFQICRWQAGGWA